MLEQTMCHTMYTNLKCIKNENEVDEEQPLRKQRHKYGHT